MTRTLTDQDFRETAENMGVEVAAIRAVAEVESARGGFDEDGRVILRFERHRFRKYTDGRYDDIYPDISAPYRKGQPGGRGLFNKAFALDSEAAMLSTSWGRFQIMGDEHERCGYRTVGEFVDAMRSGERAQLDAFVAFCASKNLTEAIRNKDWAAFARGYNGASYRDNCYDEKMAEAYGRHKAESDAETFAPRAAASGATVTGVPVAEIVGRLAALEARVAALEGKAA